MSELRANLSGWLRRAREGDEVVTERGVPSPASSGSKAGRGWKA